MAASSPLHTDRSRGSFLEFMSPALAVALVILGLLQGDPISVVMGGGLLTYVWFTRHVKYAVYLDQLVIYYGKPRRRIVPLADIDSVRVVRSSIGGQGLIIARKGGGAMVLRPRDPEGFTAALERARGVSPARQIERPGEPSKPKRSRSRPRRAGSRRR